VKLGINPRVLIDKFNFAKVNHPGKLVKGGILGIAGSGFTQTGAMGGGVNRYESFSLGFLFFPSKCLWSWAWTPLSLCPLLNLSMTDMRDLVEKKYQDA
jgi:hypothetical protein